MGVSGIAQATRLRAKFEEQAEIAAGAARIRERTSGPSLWFMRAKPLVDLVPSRTAADWRAIEAEYRGLADRAQNVIDSIERRTAV